MQRMVTILFLFFTTAAVAQQPPKPPTIEERLKKTGELLKKEAQLNAAQEKQVQSIFRDFFTAADQLHKENPPPPPPPRDARVKEQLDKLLKERDQKVQRVLTATQFSKYQEAIKKLHPPGPPPGKQPPSSSQP